MTGVSYLEAWSYNLEWQAKEQVELHTMEIYEGYKHIYGEKLESALSKIEDSVKTGIEYGSVISWELKQCSLLRNVLRTYFYAE